MCIVCESKLNPEAMDAFGERFVQMLNHGAVMMMISVGFRTGLFEAMRDSAVLTSDELAERAGLNERYVREWLGAMATGGIVNCDETGRNFHLPPEHAVQLTHMEGGENLAFLSQYVSMIGFIEDRLIECFHNGGGVPYSAFPRFHEIMEMDSTQSIVDPLFEHVLPIVPGLPIQLANGIKVLDIGCGRGRALLKMAERYPQSEFTGYDLSDEAIAYANRKATDKGLRNVRFIQRDLTDFHLTADEDSFDFVTAFDAIHDQARPDQVLHGIRRTLKPGGIFLMQDIGASSNVAENRDHLLGPLLYGISCAHCMTVSLAQGGLGLGAMWGEQLTREYLSNAGFSDIEKHELEHDFQNYYYVVRN